MLELRKIQESVFQLDAELIELISKNDNFDISYLGEQVSEACRIEIVNTETGEIVGSFSSSKRY